MITRREFITTTLAATASVVLPGLACGQPFSSSLPSESKGAMENFRFLAKYATDNGFIGAFPNFYLADRGLSNYSGSILIKKVIGAEWRDVPLVDLKNPSLEDFGERFRATQIYATKEGFVGGFPNFFQADYGKGIVCGTILLKDNVAEWRDVPLVELGTHAKLDSIAERFKGTQDYAKRNGFVGGFPNMFHADYGKGIVCGTILLRDNVAEWRDIITSTDPH